MSDGGRRSIEAELTLLTPMSGGRRSPEARIDPFHHFDPFDHFDPMSGEARDPQRPKLTHLTPMSGGGRRSPEARIDPFHPFDLFDPFDPYVRGQRGAGGLQRPELTLLTPMSEGVAGDLQSPKLTF